MCSVEGTQFALCGGVGMGVAGAKRAVLNGWQCGECAECCVVPAHRKTFANEANFVDSAGVLVLVVRESVQKTAWARHIASTGRRRPMDARQ